MLILALCASKKFGTKMMKPSSFKSNVGYHKIIMTTGRQ